VLLIEEDDAPPVPPAPPAPTLPLEEEVPPLPALLLEEDAPPAPPTSAPPAPMLLLEEDAPPVPPVPALLLEDALLAPPVGRQALPFSSHAVSAHPPAARRNLVSILRMSPGNGRSAPFLRGNRHRRWSFLRGMTRRGKRSGLAARCREILLKMALLPRQLGMPWPQVTNGRQMSRIPARDGPTPAGDHRPWSQGTSGCPISRSPAEEGPTSAARAHAVAEDQHLPPDLAKSCRRGPYFRRPCARRRRRSAPAARFHEFLPTMALLPPPVRTPSQKISTCRQICRSPADDGPTSAAHAHAVAEAQDLPPDFTKPCRRGPYSHWSWRQKAAATCSRQGLAYLRASASRPRDSVRRPP
jgi:hypothetical protein